MVHLLSRVLQETSRTAIRRPAYRFSYLLNHWKPLALFLREPAAPLDNKITFSLSAVVPRATRRTVPDAKRLRHPGSGGCSPAIRQVALQAANPGEPSALSLACPALAVTARFYFSFGEEVARASLSRRKATHSGTWASLRPCSKSGPRNR